MSVWRTECGYEAATEAGALGEGRGMQRCLAMKWGIIARVAGHHCYPTYDVSPASARFGMHVRMPAKISPQAMCFLLFAAAASQAAAHLTAEIMHSHSHWRCRTVYTSYAHLLEQPQHTSVTTNIFSRMLCNAEPRLAMYRSTDRRIGTLCEVSACSAVCNCVHHDCATMKLQAQKPTKVSKHLHDLDKTFCSHYGHRALPRQIIHLL